MVTLVNRAKVLTSSTGTTSPISLGSAVSGFQTLADAGVTNGQTVRYVIEDGANWEIGSGTYNSTGPTLSRTPSESSNAGSLISLSGSAVVFITAAAEDILQEADLTAGTGISITGSTITNSAPDQTVSITGSGAITASGTYPNFEIATPGYTDSDVDTHLNTGTASASEVLSWTGSDYDWVAVSGYTDADVDTHLNTSTAASGEVLSWNGSDYDWVTGGGGATDIDGLSDGYSVGFSVGLGSGALANDDGTNNYNTAIGASAGNLTSTGSDNVFIGGQAGDTVTTGRWNTVIGRSADVTSGGTQLATAIGYLAIASNSTVAIGDNAKASGANQVAIGSEAAKNTNSSATNSIAIGREAGQYVRAADNISIGYRSIYGLGSFNVTGAGNVAVGTSTGEDLSTGTYNFLGGYLSGANLTTGSNNVALGKGALDAATTGGRNVAIGQDAMGLGVATSANGDNVAIGFRAGNLITSGTNNVAIGNGALDAATTGGRNIAIGQAAMGNGVLTNSSGDNVAIGYQSGFDLTSGTDNFLGGYTAGSNLTTGSANIAIGERSLAAATTGSYTVAMGYLALNAITTQTANTAVGASSQQTATGEYNTSLGRNTLGSVSGNDNTAVGYSAGNSLTTGNDNVYIGYSAGNWSTLHSTGSNCIIIGNQADPSSTSADNEITLGNTSITRFRIPGAGIDNTSAALSGTTPSVDVGARDTYTLTTSGNTTFTFTGVPSSGQVGTFSLIITAGGTHTLTWPASVDWAGGTAPDAPASGEKDIYTFMTVDGGTTWYGFLAGDAMA